MSCSRGCDMQGTLVRMSNVHPDPALAPLHNCAHPLDHDPVLNNFLGFQCEHAYPARAKTKDISTLACGCFATMFKDQRYIWTTTCPITNGGHGTGHWCKNPADHFPADASQPFVVKQTAFACPQAKRIAALAQQAQIAQGLPLPTIQMDCFFHRSMHYVYPALPVVNAVPAKEPAQVLAMPESDDDLSPVSQSPVQRIPTPPSQAPSLPQASQIPPQQLLALSAPFSPLIPPLHIPAPASSSSSSSSSSQPDPLEWLSQAAIAQPAPDNDLEENDDAPEILLEILSDHAKRKASNNAGDSRATKRRKTSDNPVTNDSEIEPDEVLSSEPSQRRKQYDISRHYLKQFYEAGSTLSYGHSQNWRLDTWHDTGVSITNRGQLKFIELPYIRQKMNENLTYLVLDPDRTTNRVQYYVKARIKKGEQRKVTFQFLNKAGQLTEREIEVGTSSGLGMRALPCKQHILDSLPNGRTKEFGDFIGYNFS